AGNWGNRAILTGNQAIAQPGTWNAGALGVRATTEIDTDDNSDKVTYVSPSFYGLTVGATYIPNVLSEDFRGVEGASVNTLNGNTQGAVPGYGVGALYANTYGDFGVKVSAGYVWYNMTRAVTSAQNPTAGLGYHGDANVEWSVGTNLSYKGFTVGGSYRNIEDKVAFGFNSGKGYVWDAGINYASGPYAVSFSYLHSQAEGSTTIAADLKEEVYQASGKYSLGPGVDVLASAGYVKYTGETSADADNNKGWVVMSGLSLAF
ncbi:MAG TPA: porin, partial [Magnetospirillum sp.]|nr:porin [Magnetospirillum sp.]